MGFNNLVDIIETTLYDDDGYRKMAMRKVKGVTLSTLKSSDRGLYKEALEKTLEVSDKLNKLGVAHGDLHNENILYDPETKEVTFLDFAFATGLNTESDYSLRYQMVVDRSSPFDNLVFADNPTFNTLVDKAGYSDMEELLLNMADKEFLEFLKDIGDLFFDTFIA